MNQTAWSLNKVTHSIANTCLMEIIEKRKIVEGKQLLIHTNKTFSEIGFELGYTEQSLFNRLFRPKTGLTLPVTS